MANSSASQHSTPLSGVSTVVGEQRVSSAVSALMLVCRSSLAWVTCARQRATLASHTRRAAAESTWPRTCGWGAGSGGAAAAAPAAAAPACGEGTPARSAAATSA
jgi:hypothetical protein